MINVQQYKPKKELSRYIRRISVFESIQNIKYNQKLTPSAYSILSYNHFDVPSVTIGEIIKSNEHKLQIVGPKTRDDIVVNFNGKVKQILVEFSATGFYYLFHTSPSKLINEINSAELFLNFDSPSLEIELKKTNDNSEILSLIETWILGISSNAIPFCDYIEKAVSLLEKSNGSIKVAELSAMIYKSQRQFERRFQELIGLSPKHFSKIIQLHNVINLMQKKDYSSIQDLSYKANFYDAPSFSKRFKDLTGFSPSEFIESDEHIALKYFTDLP
jgi:AraC-like DNA-binding protein